MSQARTVMLFGNVGLMGMGGSKRSGFTLIELLCVTAIIGILGSMLLGAISRAFGRVKRFEWEVKSHELTERFEDRMKETFGRVPTYPALSIEQLYEGRMIDSILRDFLKDKKRKVLSVFVCHS